MIFSSMESELFSLICDQIAAVAFYRNTIVVKRLSKPRSGKILRKTIRQIAKGEQFTIPSIIDNLIILIGITHTLINRKVGNAFQ